MTPENEEASACSGFAHVLQKLLDRTDEPVAAYQEFVRAVGRCDADIVLARICGSYGRGLRRWHNRPSFRKFFELWCENYPRHLEVTACFVDDDTAILETQAETEGGLPLLGRVTLVHCGDAWRVSSERCADGRTRIPAARLSPRQAT